MAQLAGEHEQSDAMTAAHLNGAIVLDQLRAVRKTVAISLPVNMALGLAALLVAWNSGRGGDGAVWFGVSAIVNALRLLLCRFPIREAGEALPRMAWSLGTDQHLRAHWVLALASGLVWAAVPLLCDGYTSPQTLFYLTVVCGITAGAVTHGFAYAIIPLCFITPPLLSVVGCLVWAGGFDRYCLAATVLLYLTALARASRVGDALVRNESQLKHEATALSRSLEQANDRVLRFADVMQQRSIHDDLTGLLNRRGFTEAVEAHAPDRSDVCLMLLDLDGFKTVNDAFGHKAGDRVLAEVARRLRDALPAGAVAARIGGDEFAVFFALDGAASDDATVEGMDGATLDPATLATHLIAAITIPFGKFDAGRIGVGIGLYTGRHADLDDMLASADAALYAAKTSGRNRFRLFDETLRRDVQMKRDIERDLAVALTDGALEVWYQPILADGGRRADTLEALLRWWHPRHGWVSPEAIVSEAATAGLSEPLMTFILGQVAGMIRRLDAMGLGNVMVAMNVSPREMAQIPVDDLILGTLARMEVAPTRLEIEITEEIAVDPRAVQGKLAVLAHAGVRIAIDDFGTGYSSLGSLQQLRAGRVKIDRSFVSGIAGSPSCRSLVDAVLRVSQSFGFEVVAEGVETAEDVETLRRLGCSIMQGYYFARPMPAIAATDWLDELVAAGGGPSGRTGG